MICKDCWQVFTDNLSNSRLVDDETFKSIENGLELKNDRTGSVLVLRTIQSSRLTQEEFDYLKKNKDKFYFIGKRKEYTDELGFTKVEWA
jgi:hypothetical protein